MLTYNGVTLRVEQSSVDQRGWYSADGKDLLGTHFVITTRSIWSPYATNSGSAVGIASVAALRQTLMTPRKQLVFSVPANGSSGSSVLLRSPHNIPVGYQNAGTPFDMDDNLGPCPVYCNVSEIQGERTCMVEYQIETWLVECTTIHAISSHRWEVSHSYDRDYFSTRVIRGTVVFRGEWVAYWSELTATNASYQIGADLSRMRLFPPIPGNFKREPGIVTIAPDGLTANYEIHDVEMPSNIHPTVRRKITRVEATYSESEGAFSFDPGGFTDAVMSLAGAMATRNPMVAAGAAGAVSNMTRGMYPMTATELNIQVWGRRTASKDDLITALVAAVVAFNFAGPSDATFAGSIINGIMNNATSISARALFNTSFFVIDLVNATAKYQGKAEFPTLAVSSLRRMGLMPGTPPPIRLNFPNAITNLTTWNDGATQGPGADNQSRPLDFLQKAVTAAIKEPCVDISTPNY